MALANRLWPDLIMHPQPLSDEKPFWSDSWLFRRIEKDRAAMAFGSWDLAMG